MTKAPTPTEKSKKQRDNTKTPPKTSITQRLRTDLGRSVGVTIATQLVWLNQLTGSQSFKNNISNSGKSGWKNSHVSLCQSSLLLKPENSNWSIGNSLSWSIDRNKKHLYNFPYKKKLYTLQFMKIWDACLIWWFDWHLNRNHSFLLFIHSIT